MRILINQLKNIGDALLATTAIELVRKVYPDAWITLMTVPQVVPFFEKHPLIDEILLFAYKSKESSISSMMKIVAEIKKRNFDVNISLESRLRTLLVAVSGNSRAYFWGWHGSLWRQKRMLSVFVHAFISNYRPRKRTSK
ncbi:MAG: hypothetical protein EOM34_13835 [Clostridia bacterium]|nr:hypothetical protein [Clostridia bacterium]NCC99920.1 hypothetical protein [Bacteroidia bacterium]